MPGKKGRTRAPNAKVLRDVYHSYIKGKRSDPKLGVAEPVFIGVCTMINELMITSIIEGKLTEVAPIASMGKFTAVKRAVKYNKLRVDWKKTQEYGKLMYHDNRHTKGFYCTFKWVKPKRNLGRIAMNFKILSKYDKLMSNLFGSNKVDYPVSETYKARYMERKAREEKNA